MTRDEIIHFFARRDAAWNSHDAAALTADHATDCVYESPLAGTTVGRAAIDSIYRGLFESFPDFTIKTTDLLVDGDKAVHVVIASGTDLGGFMDLPPTGKHFSFLAVAVYTLHDGLVTRQQTVYDFTGWLVQIGVLKAKPK